MPIFNLPIRQTLARIYLDWVNNFLTTAKFAAYYEISESKAHKLIKTARACAFRVYGWGV